jgi:nitrogenase-stabilizing/protective protein
MTALLKDLEALSGAEEFFDYLGVAFDPRVLAAARLHVLKRFHDYLGDIRILEAMPPPEQREACRSALQRAYDEFTTSPALAVGAFSRLENIRRAFVPLASVSVRRHRDSRV